MRVSANEPNVTVPAAAGVRGTANAPLRRGALDATLYQAASRLTRIAAFMIVLFMIADWRIVPPGLPLWTVTLELAALLLPVSLVVAYRLDGTQPGGLFFPWLLRLSDAYYRKVTSWFYSEVKLERLLGILLLAAAPLMPVVLAFIAMDGHVRTSSLKAQTPASMTAAASTQQFAAAQESEHARTGRYQANPLLLQSRANVDTGALVPAGTLQRLGVSPDGQTWQALIGSQLIAHRYGTPPPTVANGQAVQTTPAATPGN